MSTDFDPYYKWLGIPPKDQPPNHYRLLGIERYEPDDEVIDAASNRVMGYLQNIAAGEQAADSQRLLNELAAARLCLLDAERKAQYDATLREETPREQQGAASKTPPPRNEPSRNDPSPPLPPRATTHRAPVSTLSSTSSPTMDSSSSVLARKARKRRNNQVVILALSIVFVLLCGAAYHVLTRDVLSSDGHAADNAGESDEGEAQPNDKTKKRPKSNKTKKRDEKQLPPLAVFDPNRKPPVESGEPDYELPPETREAFANWMEEAEKAVRANRPGKAAEILDRYLRYGDAPNRERAEHLREECFYADIGLEDAAFFLADMQPDELLALEQGILRLRIQEFEFTHPNLEEAFYNRLRRHIATLKERR